MEVILREDIEKLGARGQVVKVAAATPAISCCPSGWPWRPPNPTRRSSSRSARRTCARKPSEVAERAGSGQDAGAACRDRSAQKAGENDQLFGSVTAKDIAELLEKKNFTIDRRKIQLDEPIKKLGEHKVAVRLHRDVIAEVTVQVVKEEE